MESKAFAASRQGAGRRLGDREIKTLLLINADDADGKEFPFLFRSALSAFISSEIFLFDTRHTLEC
jgi:hypothetical protein